MITDLRQAYGVDQSAKRILRIIFVHILGSPSDVRALDGSGFDYILQASPSYTIPACVGTGGVNLRRIGTDSPGYDNDISLAADLFRCGAED